MTKWQRVGDDGRPIYRSLHDPVEMYGIKRIDILPGEKSGIVVTVETVDGTIAVVLHSADVEALR